jgi:pilus assembly protein CpaE
MTSRATRLIIILSSHAHEGWAQEVVATLQATEPAIIVGSPLEVSEYLAQNSLEPTEIVIDIGTRGRDVLEEIDKLAEHCIAETRVVAVGQTNDVSLYRALLARGVLDYIPMPASMEDITRAFSNVQRPQAASAAPASGRDSKVIAFMSAGSGDGSSTLALNTAYALSNILPDQQVILIDMDYQYGMVAKHLDLQAQYGIRELFDHPDRGVDSTLIRRMVAKYGKLSLITAPSELRFVPNLQAEAMQALLQTLKQSYDIIILDLPHFWQPWVATACQHSNLLVMVAQLWLKSTTHAARIMKVLRELGITQDRISLAINRAGAKFKEAIEPTDFERVCGGPIRYYVTNDIRTIGAAEAQAKTVLQLERSKLADDIEAIARGLVGLQSAGGGDLATESGGGLRSLFSKLSK